jgi:hypothetical protein
MPAPYSAKPPWLAFLVLLFGFGAVKKMNFKVIVVLAKNLVCKYKQEKKSDAAIFSHRVLLF